MNETYSNPEKSELLSKEELIEKVLEYRGFIFSICKSKLESNQDAEDATQEALLRATQAIESGKLKNQESLKAWIRIIARRSAIDIRRSNSSHNNEEVNSDIKITSKSLTTDYVESINFLLKIIEENLSEEQKNAIKLFIEGYTEEEIAAELEVNKNTVHSRIRLAKNEIKRLLATKEIDPEKEFPKFFRKNKKND